MKSHVTLVLQCCTTAGVPSNATTLNAARPTLALPHTRVQHRPHSAFIATSDGRKNLAEPSAPPNPTYGRVCAFHTEHGELKEPRSCFELVTSVQNVSSGRFFHVVFESLLLHFPDIPNQDDGNQTCSMHELIFHSLYHYFMMQRRLAVFILFSPASSRRLSHRPSGAARGPRSEEPRISRRCSRGAADAACPPAAPQAVPLSITRGSGWPKE